MKSQFDDEGQKIAIKHGKGPACVLAGPGSGKTYIITHRIQNLINQLGVSPCRILVITFTRAAANEMRQRFLDLSKGRGAEVTFGTFHSVYLSFLKEFDRFGAADIINPVKQRNIISNILCENKMLNSNVCFAVDQTEDLISAISFYKSCDKKIPPNYNKDLFNEFITEYEECLKAANSMDFDDILLKCRDMLLSSPEILIRLKKRFDHILVDEFQDINKVQYEILNLILSEEENIFVVGDDDQSIYGFRGASPDIIGTFFNDFPRAKKIELKMNYRSGQNIINAASKVIVHNRYRQKNVSYESPYFKDPGVFELKILENVKDELEFIRRKVEFCRKEGRSYCVLVRTNKDALKISEYLKTNTVSQGFTDREDNIKREIFKDISAYISFCKNFDRNSMYRIIKAPASYLSKDIFTEDPVDLNALANRFRGSFKASALDKLNRHISILKKSTPYAFLTYLFNIVGYKEYILERFSKSSAEKAMEFLNECIKYAEKSSELSEFKLLLDKNVSEYTGSEEKEQNFIMTFHASKGLEFDTVIIPGVNEGKIPGRASFETGDCEEERRLFYVAMTRAINALYITAIKRNDSMRMLPSRFITEFIQKEEDHILSKS